MCTDKSFMSKLNKNNFKLLNLSDRSKIRDTIVELINEN